MPAPTPMAKREAHRDRRWTCPEELRSPQAAWGAGGSAQGSPRMLYRSGGVRTEPEAARGQRLRQAGRGEVGARRPSVAGWAASVRPLRAALDGELLGQSAGTAV